MRIRNKKRAGGRQQREPPPRTRVTWTAGTAWRRPARSRVPTGPAGRARAPTGRAHAQGGAPPLPRGEGVYGEAAAAAAEAEAEAAAMAPFPEEVDVFTAPHWRMKQLVGLYCDKVTACGASCSGAARAGRRSRPCPWAARPEPRPQPPGPRRANCRLRSCQRLARHPAPSPGSPRLRPAVGLRRALGAGGAAHWLGAYPPPSSGPASSPHPPGRGAPSLLSDLRGPRCLPLFPASPVTTVPCPPPRRSGVSPSRPSPSILLRDLWLASWLAGELFPTALAALMPQLRAGLMGEKTRVSPLFFVVIFLLATFIALSITPCRFGYKTAVLCWNSLRGLQCKGPQKKLVQLSEPFWALSGCSVS